MQLHAAPARGGRAGCGRRCDCDARGAARDAPVHAPRDACDNLVGGGQRRAWPRLAEACSWSSGT
eukprot:3223142-Rhodomonas_salina.1